MAKISEPINMSFRVDKELKQKADKLFKELGLNTSVALNMFLSQCVRNQALPFVPSRIEKNNSVSEEINEVKENTQNSYYDFENLL